MPRTTLREQFTPEQRAEWKPRIVARNTFQFTRDGETVIRLHGTDIVRKRPDGSCILNSGGWKTVTTKDRMNRYMPAGYTLWQDKGIWYVANSSSPWRDNNVTRVPYEDGIKLPDCFKFAATLERGAEKEKKLRAQVRRFVAKLDKLECLPEPSAGDCWYCSMFDRANGPGDVGKIKGDDHIREHIREGYLHGSLIFNALTWAGYRDPSFIWHMYNSDLAQGRKPPDSVKRALKRYLYRKLGLAA